MAQTVTNKAKYLLTTGALVPGTADLRIGLLKTLASHSNVPDLDTVSGMEAHADFAELTASGYARVTLTSEAATEDDANDRVNIDSDNAAFAAISAGETIVGAFIYKHNGAADSGNDLVAIYDLTSTPTNGGAVTVNIADFLRVT